MSTSHTESDTRINQPVPRKEMRKLERFSLKLPTRIQVLKGNFTLDLVTGDISADGAFFPTSEPLPEGLKVLVEITLKRENGVGNGAKVHLKGKVLRCQSDGMAVRFGKRVQMTPR